MASILDLQQYSENKRAREMANNPLQQLVTGFDLGIKMDMAKREEQRKMQQEQQKALDLYKQKAMIEAQAEQQKAVRDQRQALELYRQKTQIDAEVSAKEEIAKQGRAGTQLKRNFEIFRELQSQPDRTMAGDTRRVIEGGKAKELERKARIIDRAKVTPKLNLVTGELSATMEDKSPIEILQEEIAYGFYETPQEIVKRGMELGADANKLEALATTAAIPGVMGDTQIQGQQIPEGMKPAGYERDKFGNMVSKGFEPITAQDMKAEQEMAMALSTEQTKTDTAKMNAESALRSIQDVKSNIKEFGLLGRVPAIPGTSKVIWEKNIDRVKAMLTLEKLMELKRASSTGASGLGALSEGERRNLEDAASALDKGLPPAKAEEYLDEIERTLTKVLQPKSQAQQQRQLPANDPLGLR